MNPRRQLMHVGSVGKVERKKDAHAPCMYVRFDRTDCMSCYMIGQIFTSMYLLQSTILNTFDHNEIFRKTATFEQLVDLH